MMPSLSFSSSAKETLSSMGVVPKLIECDYYDYLKEDRSSSGKSGGVLLRQYRGEYMSQYSWSEATNSSLRQAYSRLS
jgi:hypothetical protein